MFWDILGIMFNLKENIIKVCKTYYSTGMAKRIRTHILEDESRIAFMQALPAEWVYRDKDKDYGIDCEVEIFE